MWGNRVHVITQRLSYVYSPTLTPTYSPKNFNFSTHIVHVCKHIVENTYIGTDENNKNVFFNYMLRITPHCIILSLNASRSTTTKHTLNMNRSLFVKLKNQIGLYFFFSEVHIKDKHPPPFEAWVIMNH